MIGCWQRTQVSPFESDKKTNSAKQLQDRHSDLYKEPGEVGDVSPFNIQIASILTGGVAGSKINNPNEQSDPKKKQVILKELKRAKSKTPGNKQGHNTRWETQAKYTHGVNQHGGNTHVRDMRD